MNPNWVEMIKQLQASRPGMGQPWGGGTAFAGGSPTFRETGRAIPPGPIPMGMPPQLGRTGDEAAYGPQNGPVGGAVSPWGGGGPMRIGGAPQGPSMPSQPAMQGALGQVLGSMQAQPGAIGRMMPQMQGGFTPPPMPQMQGAQPRTLSQIMASQQPVSPWGSGGPMRARSTY